MQLQRYRSIAGLSSLYLFFCTVVVSMLFVIGNLQSFLESTNRLLIDILEWVLYILLITNMYYLLFFAAEYIRKKSRMEKIEKRLGSIWSAAVCVYALGYLIFINAVVVWL